MTFWYIRPTKTNTYTHTVQQPLMPKGVEHYAIQYPYDIVGLVQQPLMPKGVEH